MFCEIDKYAATSYCAVHGVNSSLNLGDITKADEKSVPDFNVMVGGSPCFVAGTPIITASGYKNIEDVSLRDLVLTHTGSFKRIKRIGSDDNKHIWRVCAQGILPIRCTENHPFLILKKGSAEPEWVQASQINKGDCIAVPIPRPSDCINDAEITKEEAWILGRYIADGYISKNQIVLCIGKDKLSDLDNLVGIPYRLTRKSESCTGCHIKSDRLLGIIRQFGMDKYSYEKEIPPQLLFGNEDILRRVLDGYFSGDGCRIKDAIQATTTSKKLAMSICLAIQKVYGVGPKIYFEKRPETYKIDGRIISQRDTYMVRALLQKTGKEHYVEDAERGYYWYPVRSVSDEESFERVYNMEVLDDNSYVAGNAVVHNCQDFSIAGKQGGGDVALLGLRTRV